MDYLRPSRTSKNLDLQLDGVFKMQYIVHDKLCSDPNGYNLFGLKGTQQLSGAKALTPGKPYHPTQTSWGSENESKE